MDATYQRTHHCNALSLDHVGQRVDLSGWVNSCRNLGGLVFIDLRDREGVTQLVIDPATQPELASRAGAIREEWVIAATGTVRARPEAMVNRQRPTGAIEVAVDGLEILNRAAPMPFNLEDPSVSEDLRLKYRYLDMRRSGLVSNLRLRHKITKVVPRAPATTSSPAASTRDASTPSPRRPSSTNRSSWSAAWNATSRSRGASAMRTSAPTASRSSPRSTWR